MTFTSLARTPHCPVDELALAVAAELGPADAALARRRLAALATPLDGLAAEPPQDALRTLRGTLAGPPGFEVQATHEPEGALLDVVLERRRGLPIALSVLWTALARRAGVPLVALDVPDRELLAHVGALPAIVVDVERGGTEVAVDAAHDALRPRCPHRTVLRMLNAIIAGAMLGGDYARAIRAAELRVLLPVDEATRRRFVEGVRSIQARLN